MRTRLLAALSGLCLVASGLAAQDLSRPTLNLTFGVYTSDKATVMYRMFTPVLEALQECLEGTLGRPVDIRMRIYKTYAEGLEALVRGDVDFARFGPASYVMARKRNPGLQLLAMEAKKGKKRFHGIICVRAASSIRNLKDLRAKSFAFGDANSTIGRYLSQALLVEAGIHAKDLKRFAYLGRHDKVAKAVLLGDFDAGALKESTFKRYNRGGQLRALVTFENVTKPWVARAGLEEEVVAALRQALLSLKDREALKPLKVTGFLPTTDREYDPIRKAMQAAAAFTKD